MDRPQKVRPQYLDWAPHHLQLQAVLPDFQTQYANLGKFWSVLQWYIYVGKFNGHLVFLLVYFCRFGMLNKDKSGNPDYMSCMHVHT
jgi:hypothetical protein